jgi:hypothetical protein
MKNDESLDEKSDEFWSAFRQIRYARERKKERSSIHRGRKFLRSFFRRRRRQKRERRRRERRRTSDGDGEGALLLLLLLFFFSSFSVASFSLVEIS